MLITRFFYLATLSARSSSVKIVVLRAFMVLAFYLLFTVSESNLKQKEERRILFLEKLESVRPLISKKSGYTP